LYIAAAISCFGYGASFGGVAALLTMLNTCAPGVTVVNIDNGFGAAASAYKMLRLKQQNREGNNKKE
jgi:NCAIR mutase (PurE)-related protein